MYLKDIKQLIFLSVVSFIICNSCQHEEHKTHHIGVLPVTTPMTQDTTTYQEFVCQIHSFQHIELRAMEKGYLEKTLVDEGEFVTQGQLLFQIQPTIYEAEAKMAEAEVDFATIEYENTKALADSNIVSSSELALAKATLEKAKAELSLSKAHLKFTEVRAPFRGIVGKFEDVRLGSLLDEGELLTTLSDNSKVWVYFNVPESQYLDYASRPVNEKSQMVKLRLANQKIFEIDGVIETIESDFNKNTGNIAFRATFDNPKGLLRHGQTGTILWPKELTGHLAIPQKATFEVLDKKFVFVVDSVGKVHSREVKIAQELDHIYLLENGLANTDRILLDGLRKVRNGDQIEFEFVKPKSVFAQLQLHAE